MRGLNPENTHFSIDVLVLKSNASTDILRSTNSPSLLSNLKHRIKGKFGFDPCVTDFSSDEHSLYVCCVQTRKSAKSMDTIVTMVFVDNAVTHTFCCFY